MIPPTVGVAIGFVISNPEPEKNMTGKRDNSVVITVMSFGRNRKAEPSMIAFSIAFRSVTLFSRLFRSSA